MSTDTPNPSSTFDTTATGRRGLIDVPALAVELGIAQRFIRRLVAEDRVPFLKIGKFVRSDPRQIDEWVDSCRPNSSKTPTVASGWLQPWPL